MRALPVAAALACAVLSGCGTLAGGGHRPAAFDHHDPVALNEAAVARVRQGDLTTAWILLERAARLAPHDPRIAHNLALVRASRAGKELPVAVPSAAAARPPEPAGASMDEAAVRRAFPPPPPLWTPR